MVDTHTHLYMPEFAAEGQAAGSMAGQCEAVDRAVAAGVNTLVLPNVDRASIEPMLALHNLRPRSTYVAMGLHPTEVNDAYLDELDYICGLIDAEPDKFVAVGEIGIDLYWDKTFERQQMDAFEHQLQVARRHRKPVIIHCREGLDQVLEVMQPYGGDVSAVFHSFGGTIADVERIRRVGADSYFGINGIVTFKNSRLAEVLPAIGADRILTETDSPFLAPTPHRGKRNESAWIPLIVDKIASSLMMDGAEMADITTRNAYEFLKINK